MAYPKSFEAIHLYYLLLDEFYGAGSIAISLTDDKSLPVESGITDFLYFVRRFRLAVSLRFNSLGKKEQKACMCV